MRDWRVTGLCEYIQFKCFELMSRKLLKGRTLLPIPQRLAIIRSKKLQAGIQKHGVFSLLSSFIIISARFTRFLRLNRHHQSHSNHHHRPQPTLHTTRNRCGTLRRTRARGPTCTRRRTRTAAPRTHRRSSQQQRIHRIQRPQLRSQTLPTNPLSRTTPRHILRTQLKKALNGGRRKRRRIPRRSNPSRRKRKIGLLRRRTTSAAARRLSKHIRARLLEESVVHALEKALHRIDPALRIREIVHQTTAIKERRARGAPLRLI